MKEYYDADLTRIANWIAKGRVQIAILLFAMAVVFAYANSWVRHEGPTYLAVWLQGPTDVLTFLVGFLCFLFGVLLLIWAFLDEMPS